MLNELLSYKKENFVHSLSIIQYFNFKNNKFIFKYFASMTLLLYYLFYCIIFFLIISIIIDLRIECLVLLETEQFLRVLNGNLLS